MKTSKSKLTISSSLSFTKRVKSFGSVDTGSLALLGLLCLESIVDIYATIERVYKNQDGNAMID